MSKLTTLIRRRLVKRMLVAAAVLLVPMLVATAGLGLKVASASHSSEPPVYGGPLPEPPTADPAKPIAVVLSSTYGAEITDFLPTFEILARSSAFNTYALAPERKVIPLVNSNMKPTSLDFVPHYSFAEYDRIVGRAPDLIAVPWFPNYTPERDAAVLEWIRQHAGPNTTLMTICAGTEIMADTGLLEGHTVTTNTGWLDKLQARFPTVTWVRGMRYVDDGAVITSSNLAAGIDATLHVVDRVAGRAIALNVARELGYEHTRYLDDPRFEPPSMRFIAGIAVNAAVHWREQEMGVMLYDGVSELALASLLDVYGATFTTNTEVMAREVTPIRSRNGLVFIPRIDFATAPPVDRAVLPGGDDTQAREDAIRAWTSLNAGKTVEAIHENVGASGTAYDTTLQDLARTQNGLIAQSMHDAMFYAAN
jgi:transcriptional regulator GlxA family with amidase domain